MVRRNFTERLKKYNKEEYMLEERSRIAKLLQGRLVLTVEELAKVLTISRAKAYELVKSKGFPSLKIDKRVVISVDGLREWLKKESNLDI